jgi:hypothetical protein
VYPVRLPFPVCKQGAASYFCKETRVMRVVLTVAPRPRDVPPPLPVLASETAPSFIVQRLGAQRAPDVTRSGARERKRRWPSSMRLCMVLPRVCCEGGVLPKMAGAQGVCIRAPCFYPNTWSLKLPYPAAEEAECILRFDVFTRLLVLTMPVLPQPRDAPDTDSDSSDEEEKQEQWLRELINQHSSRTNSAAAIPCAAKTAPPAAPAAAVEDTVNDDDSCVVCLVAARSVGLLHGTSMHVVVCAPCAEQLQGDSCPVCRQRVERLVLNVYR